MLTPMVFSRAPWGTGKPYGNISGAANFDAASGIWTVTGAATVDIVAETGAAVLMCKRIVIDGGVLSVAEKCKGLLLFSSQGGVLINGGQVSMSKLGKAGNFGALTPLDLLPAACVPFIHRGQLAKYVVAPRGAEGVPGVSGGRWAVGQAGTNGLAAGPMQTGGGGSGANRIGASGKSGCGGPCCGGAGSGGADGGNTQDAGDYGGPGSAGTGYSDSIGGGGSGDPVGVGGGYAPGAHPGEGPGGGLLMFFTPSLSIASGCVMAADGAPGGGGYSPGGATGGGNITVVTTFRGYKNQGTVRAAGGAPRAGYATGFGSGGGAGSINIFNF